MVEAPRQHASPVSIGSRVATAPPSHREGHHDAVVELLEAAADDLTPAPAVDRAPTVSDLEAEASDELRRFEAVEHCKAVLDAVGVEALGRLHADIDAAETVRFAALGRSTPPGWVDPERLTVMEVYTATGLGERDVYARVRLGSALGVAEAVLRPKDDAPPSAALFRQRLNRCVIAADQEAAERRRAARRRRRGAYARIDEDGLGTMTITNDAEKVIAAMERVNAAARVARQSGDERDLETLRAKVTTDLLAFGRLQPRTSGHSPTSSDAPDSGRPAPEWAARVGHRPAATVWIVVPFTTAVGLTDAPCEIPGYGWVPADQARRIMLAADSTWQCLAVDVDTG